MKYVLSIFIMHALYSAPPSAFGAGDLSSKNPYGLTITEKAILANKKNLKKVTSKYNFQNQSIASIQNDLLTIKSLVSSNFSSSDKNKKNVEKYLSNLEIKLKSLEETISNLGSSNEALKTSFLGLKDILLHINDNFVSQEELALVKKLIPKAKSKISNKQMEKLAYKAYKNKKYSKAKHLYETLVKNKYRPAKSNFYLGEVSYRQKKYRSAIEFYTNSVNLYTKSKYMPLLLYHTAKSYVYLGEKKQAKDFFNSVMKNFPKSKEYKWSKQEIKKLYK